MIKNTTELSSICCRKWKIISTYRAYKISQHYWIDCYPQNLLAAFEVNSIDLTSQIPQKPWYCFLNGSFSSLYWLKLKMIAYLFPRGSCLFSVQPCFWCNVTDGCTGNKTVSVRPKKTQCCYFVTLWRLSVHSAASYFISSDVHSKMLTWTLFMCVDISLINVDVIHALQLRNIAIAHVLLQIQKATTTTTITAHLHTI